MDIAVDNDVFWGMVVDDDVFVEINDNNNAFLEMALRMMRAWIQL